MPISLKYFMECEYKSLDTNLSFKEWIDWLSISEMWDYISGYIDSSKIDWFTFINKN